MSPSEIDQYLQLDPMPSLRLVLASGDELIVHAEDQPFVSDLALILHGDQRNKQVIHGSRLVSIPNVVLIEPVSRRPPRGRRRRLEDR